MLSKNCGVTKRGCSVLSSMGLFPSAMSVFEKQCPRNTPKGVRKADQKLPNSQSMDSRTHYQLKKKTELNLKIFQFNL